MQEIFRALGAFERPILFLAPLVGTHDENFHFSRRGELVLDALEKMVIPGEGDIILWFLLRGRSKIDVANLPPRTRVAADGDEQLLPLTRGLASAVLLDALIVA